MPQFVFLNDLHLFSAHIAIIELYGLIISLKDLQMNVFLITFLLTDEIAFLEGMTIVYKSSIDLFFYVVGSAQENEVSLLNRLVDVFFTAAIGWFILFACAPTHTFYYGES